MKPLGIKGESVIQQWMDVVQESPRTDLDDVQVKVSQKSLRRG